MGKLLTSQLLSVCTCTHINNAVCDAMFNDRIVGCESLKLNVYTYTGQLNMDYFSCLPMSHTALYKYIGYCGIQQQSGHMI